jgi:hypothetical protein
LRGRLVEAARLHHVTELRRCLRELEGLAPDSALVAADIGQALRTYDMDAVLAVLGAGPSDGAPSGVRVPS